MKALVACAALAMAAVFCSSPPASAQQLKWCATGARGTTCAFSTRAQCMVSISGVGGYCIRNPNRPRPPR
jgi:hypothetical protein